MKKPDSLFLLNVVAQSIFDKKGSNILALDVHGLSTLTDYILIAEGNVDKHVTGIAQEIIKNLKKLGVDPVYVEGLKEGDWVVIDYMHFMIHLFMPGMRDLYMLEQLFREATIVDLEIDVSSKNQMRDLQNSL